MVRLNHSEECEKLKLDKKDEKILDLISENSRIPITQLSKKIELSRENTNYKLDRLKENDLIRKFITEINYEKLGFKTYHLFLMVDESQREKELIDYLKNLKNTISILEYSDIWDLEVIILAQNLEELNQVILSIQAEFKNTIIEKSELLEIENYNSILFSYHFNKEKTLNLEKENKTKSSNNDIKLDIHDLKILEQLCEDSRQSTYKLAENINLNADTIGLRIKKLEKNNIINKFTIYPNFSKINYIWHTFCIKMKTFDEEDEKLFRNFIENHPQVIKSCKTFGEWNILMYILTPNQKEFHTLVKQIKQTFPTLIKSYITFVAYQEHHFNPFPKVLMEKYEE